MPDLPTDVDPHVIGRREAVDEPKPHRPLLELGDEVTPSLGRLGELALPEHPRRPLDDDLGRLDVVKGTRPERRRLLTRRVLGLARDLLEATPHRAQAEPGQQLVKAVGEPLQLGPP